MGCLGPTTKKKSTELGTGLQAPKQESKIDQNQKEIKLVPVHKIPLIESDFHLHVNKVQTSKSNTNIVSGSDVMEGIPNQLKMESKVMGHMPNEKQKEVQILERRLFKQGQELNSPIIENVKNQKENYLDISNVEAKSPKIKHKLNPGDKIQEYTIQTDFGMPQLPRIQTFCYKEMFTMPSSA